MISNQVWSWVGLFGRKHWYLLARRFQTTSATLLCPIFYPPLPHIQPLKFWSLLLEESRSSPPKQGGPLPWTAAWVMGLDHTLSCDWKSQKIEDQSARMWGVGCSTPCFWSSLGNLLQVGYCPLLFRTNPFTALGRVEEPCHWLTSG